MGKLTFVLGGARSGKSEFAEDIIKKCGNNVVYIATCPYYDNEMEERIEKHRERRPKEWGCYEEFKDLAVALQKAEDENKYKIALVDCLTLFITNLLMDEGLEEPQINERVKNALDKMREVSFDSVIVSNEIGMGLVPEHPLSRKFRDIAGRMNQLVAKYSDEVYLVVAGIPTKLK